MHPPERAPERAAPSFDPVRAGERYGLPRDLALALWRRAMTEAHDSTGRRDDERAEQRFHALAARLAHATVSIGRSTRVEREAATSGSRSRKHDEWKPRVPGRESLVTAEARRAPALAQQVARTFGPDAADVAITTSSAVAAGAEGVAIGEQVYIAPGYYDVATPEGRARLGHEIAHVMQQRRGRGLSAHVSDHERAGLEAEADRAGRAFARGQRFAVQGRAPAQVALFKGAKPAAAPATMTTLDLKAGGRIERKPPAQPDVEGAAAVSSAKPPKAKEQLRVSWGGVQASNPFTVERDASGNVVKLVGRGKISLPGSKYLKPFDLDISLGADGTVGAKLSASSTSTIKLGGLTVQGGTLSAAIEHGTLNYVLDGASVALPKHLGQGALSIQSNGDQEPTFDASLSVHVPKMQPATLSFHADANGYRAQGTAGVDFKQASGSVTMGLEKVGEDKALWSAAGSVGYASERLQGQVSVQYNADGELSGEGNLQFQIADFLTGQATVAVDKEGHVTVNGEIRPPNETQLFAEKKVENTFLHKSVEFPVWGISIPAVGSVGIIAFIEGSMGYRVGVGAGVMRDIVLSGQYSTNPDTQPTFGISGEIFIPAFAELLISIGGGIKLDAFLAEVGGGIKIDGRAGFYGGLSVRPSLAYDGGKYRLTGQALLAGDVGLSAQVDAFVRLHVGKWFLSWEKEWDWKLGEWNKWLGLNLGMEADLDYTLGQPLSPEIFKLKKPDSLDVQGIAKSAMPQGGMPPQGPKGAQNQKTEFHAKGGATAPAASAPSAQPKVAGTPAGAAGHKNQEPKGKQVKPGKPTKPGPAKPAKGKGPNQTGPNPKNKSKPTEQKLDAKPIVEPFSMHGHAHQLIVQLGPAGHVDMASKRERLSVKVGHAVSKLVAKHAPPQQISDLKAIGETAKKGDKMVATAKLTDKAGAAKVAQQIAAYGTKWQVGDLDEIALKAPTKLVVAHPFRLDKPTPVLAKALFTLHGGAVAFRTGGDAKELTRKLLEKHADARFDFASAQLTLPALQPDRLRTAASIEQLGQQLAQQTGVAKITVKREDRGGEIQIAAVAELGASATFGHVVVAIVPKTLTIPSVAKLDKPSDRLSESLAHAANGALAWQASVTDPTQVTAKLLREHADARFDPATENLQLPAVRAAALSAASSLSEVGQLLGQQTGVSKVTVAITGEHIDLQGHINPVVKEATVEDEPWLRAVKKAVGPDKSSALCTQLTRPTLKTLWETLGEQPFKDLIAAFPAPKDVKALIGTFSVVKLDALLKEITAADLSQLKQALSLQDLKTLVTTLTAPTMKALITATDIATLVTLSQGLKAKTLKDLLIALPPVDLKPFIDRLTAAGVVELADTIGVPTLARAKTHFLSAANLLDVLEAAKAATTPTVIKAFLAACFKDGFKRVADIQLFFTHVTGLGEADVRLAIRGAEIFVAESTGNTTPHGGRTTADPGAPVQKQFTLAGGANVTLTFGNADVLHISSRHTWAGFAMLASNAAVKASQTMFAPGTTDANLWTWGRTIMNSADLAAVLATMSPGDSRTDEPVSGFKVNVSLQGADGLVSFYAGSVSGAVLSMPKAQMKAAICLWKSK